MVKAFDSAKWLAGLVRKVDDAGVVWWVLPDARWDPAPVAKLPPLDPAFAASLPKLFKAFDS